MTADTTSRATGSRQRTMSSATGGNPFSAAERRAMAPRQRLLPVDWAERHVVVPDGEARGPFRRATMPALTSVINAIADPRYEAVAAVASTQSGKSLGLNSIPLGYWLHHERMPTGFGIPNRKLAQRVYKTKLQPIFAAAPALEKLLPRGGSGSRGGFPTEQMLNNGALWMFLGAGSEADMSQATLARLCVDETDKADDTSQVSGEADPIAQMIRRTDGYMLTRKLVYTCTPTTERGYIWQAYQAGTRGEVHVRCPFCGAWFPLTWSWDEQRLAWDDNSSERSIMATAYYPCPQCDGRLREEHRLAALRHPLWVHEGEEIRERAVSTVERTRARDDFAEAAVCPDGTAWRVEGERREVRTVSFRWNRLASPFASLGHLAAEVAAAEENAEKRHAVCIYDMGLPWAGELADELAVNAEAVLAHAEQADYRLGQIPFTWGPGCYLTVGVDLHGMWGTWLVDAWRVDSEGRLRDSWLIDMPRTETKFGQVGYVFPGQGPNRHFLFLADIVRAMCIEGWPDAAGELVRPSVVCIDAGYQLKGRTVHRVQPYEKQVYEFCVRYGQKAWRAIAGRGSLDGGRCFEPTRQGKGGASVVLWLLDRDVLNTEMLDQERTLPGATGYRYIPRDTPTYYGRSMCSEVRRTEFTKDNQLDAKWDTVDRENHLFDCRAYSWAGARMLGIRPASGFTTESTESTENG